VVTTSANTIKQFILPVYFISNINLNATQNDSLYFNVSCIILHVSIYINQPEMRNNLRVINILETLSSAHTVYFCVLYVYRLFTYPTLIYGCLQTRRKACTIHWRNSPPSGPGPPHYRGFMIILRHTRADRTPLDE